MTLTTGYQGPSTRQTGAHVPRRAASLWMLYALLSGCATGPNASPNDPLEPFNRVVFSANDKIDQYVAVPLAKGYEKVTPTPVRTAVTNFFGNLGDVGNAVNNLLQGKGEDAVNSLMRVAVNTTFGIVGLIDIATPAGLRRRSQDFGLTLGTWHIPSGPYLVLPLFGPSSFRDGAGLAVDFQLNPVTYAKPAVRNSLFGLNFVNTRTNLLGATELLQQAALDKYTFVRDGYLQRRQYLLESESSPRKLPEYDAAGETPAEQGAAQAESGRATHPGADGPAAIPGRQPNSKPVTTPSEPPPK
jgi:phospholipid-binding lipoprotein MlaA